MNRGALAIVLGRAGSKGVPGKNTRPIAGKPCAAWTIEQAQRAESVRAVMVSSDSSELLELARMMGAIASPRPEHLASDTATVDAAARHAVQAVRPELPWTTEPETPIVILYANVPVRPADLIDRAVAKLIESGCDSVQSYERVGKHHPWWMVRLDGQTGALSPWQGTQLNGGVYRRQDLPPVYLPDGGVIALSRRALMLEVDGAEPGPHAFFGADRRGIISPAGSVVDIDEEVDVGRAEAVLKASSDLGPVAGARGGSP